MSELYTPVVGDWVRMHKPGAWKIYRILSGFNETRYSLDEQRRLSRRVLVFGKKFLNSEGIPEFESGVCERSIVRALSPTELMLAKQMLASDPLLHQAFETSPPVPLKSLMNLSMALPDRASLESICRSVLEKEIATGVTMDRVLEILSEANLTEAMQKFPINTTLQFVCNDYELRDGDFVYREYRILSK